MLREMTTGMFWGLLGIVLLLTVACGQEVPLSTVTPASAHGSAPTPTLMAAATPAQAAAVSPTPTPSLFPLTITGSNGEKVVLAKPPERIVVIDDAAVEILFALGEGRRVVGADNYATYPPQASAIPKLGDAFALDFEKMAALKPDFIYTFYASPLPKMEQLGVPVLYLESPATIAQVADRMRLLGEIVDKPEAGTRLAQGFLNSIRTITDKVAGVQQGPSVYFDVAPGWWTFGSGTLGDQISTLLKAQNVFADISGSQQVSPEEIVARDPQVIISTDAEGPAFFHSQPALQNVSAVKNNRIFPIDGSLLDIPGPRLVQGIQEMAHSLYPRLVP